MKPNIHHKWYPDAKVICACGNQFTTGATVPELRVQVCAACHPFFTGKMKFVDTKGRVQKFQEKQKAAQAQTKGKKKTKATKKAPEPQRRPESLKEMLKQARKKEA
jgi:large subunit ribosomal protein L31